MFTLRLAEHALAGGRSSYTLWRLQRSLHTNLWSDDRIHVVTRCADIFSVYNRRYDRGLWAWLI